MQSFQNGEELSRRWRPALLAFFLRRVRDHAEAEDLVQELLVKLMQQRQTDISAPDAYVFRMASNLLADRSRRQKVRLQYRHMMEQSEERGVDPLDPFRITVGRTQIVQVMQALKGLPDRTRNIFILYRLENLAQDRIAETFGISVSAVKKHVAKAMAALIIAIENEP